MLPIVNYIFAVPSTKILVDNIKVWNGIMVAGSDHRVLPTIYIFFVFLNHDAYTEYLSKVGWMHTETNKSGDLTSGRVSRKCIKSLRRVIQREKIIVEEEGGGTLFFSF